MKKSFLALAFAFCCAGVFGQIQSSKNFFKDYVSRIWNAEDGIPGNTITDVLQNSDGYILIGTYGGVIRFDGVKFETINQVNDLKFYSARTIMEDSLGNLWIGSNEQGAFCIKKNGKALSFTTENGLPNNSVRAFCEDTSGNIWIGTASGVVCVSKDEKIVQLPGFEKIPDNNHFIVSQIYCDTAGRIWIITRTENGLIKYEDREFMIYDGIKSVENPVVTTMTQDATGAYWFGISPYYGVKISGNEEKLYDLSSQNKKGTCVNWIYQDSEKQIWFALDSGIKILHDGEIEHFSKEMGLAEDSVVKVIEDKEKNIWIATDRGGLQKLSYGKFQTTSMDTSVNAIAQDLNRKVTWLACDHGLYCYDNNRFVSNKITEYFDDVRIRHVSITKKGDLLVSCYEKYGQVKIDLQGNITTWTKKEGLAGNKVRVAEEMSNGDIYVGTTDGLSIIDAKTGEITNIQKSDQVENDYIMCLYEDEEGQIWCGTDGGGIFILKDKQVVRNITKKDKLSGNVVFKISGFRDEIWITTGTGASRIKNGEIFSFGPSQGFSSDGIFQLIPDFSGRLWGTSNRGIFFVKMDEIEDVIAGNLSSVNAKYFNRLDGITSGGVTSTSLSMKDDLGRIWFTLIDGFTVFDPVRNAGKNFAPEVRLEKFLVDNESVDFVNGTVVLKPDVKRIKLDFTGISFISSEQISFKTKLEGFDTDFSEWSTVRTCSYTNLKPGTYKFILSGQSGDEVPCPQDYELTIIKKPHLYEQTWFISLMILIVVLGTTCMVYRKINRLNKEKQRIEDLSIQVIQALVTTIDAKDKYTRGHSKRVANYSVMLANALGKTETERKEIYFAALLHDIGKIGIKDEILNKEGPLTKEEYDIIKTHPDCGYKILNSISIMPTISIGAHFHHECYDGNGYPTGLKGEEIPELARIIRVADAYDAMTSNRSYRDAMPQEYVRSEIEKYRGIQFDPVIADKMLEIIDKDYEYDLREEPSEKEKK